MSENPTSLPIFMVIDGSAIIHRAYHAMPSSFTNADGIPTGAVYGFFAMLLKLLHNIKPSYVAVAFDRPKPTFRQELYVGYQAQRPKASIDLGEQFGIVREILTNSAIPVYEVDGFEADDIIGTIVQKLTTEHSGVAAYIVTGDRDLMQLVNSHAKVLMPIKGISEVMLFDEKRVKEKFGIEPFEMIDYKALVGDQSDNYPGVAGIGPKTAVTLLQKYKTMEGIFEHISDIEKENKNLALKLANGADQAYLGKKLATIVRDVPFTFSFDECDISNVTKEKFVSAFGKYQLKTLTKRLDEVFGEKELNEVQKKQRQMKLL